jgi:hypothetical protein
VSPGGEPPIGRSVRNPISSSSKIGQSGIYNETVRCELARHVGASTPLPMDNKTLKHSIIVFPFLKTLDPISIGEISFRSTDDLVGLTEDDARFVSEISDMLFLQNNLRIRSASYALVPFIDLERISTPLIALERIQAVVAYCYAKTSSVFDDPFLSSEHASLVIFSPGSVPVPLVNPHHHTIATELAAASSGDEQLSINGYSGLYNFKQRFWVAKGSRLYPPVPHISLNISQILSRDMAEYHKWPEYRLLERVTKVRLSTVEERVFTGIKWFNAANSSLISEESAMVNLSIAFESLLGLPDDAKTDRLIDAVSLLLGRLPRLDVWVHQFYKVRSEIVHEGRAESLRFVASDSKKKPQPEAPIYQPLLLYGRQIFQYCVGTLLFGASLSENGGLQEKFVTNQERFVEICKVLEDDALDASKRFELVAEKVFAADRYRFIQESGLTFEALLGAARAAAKALSTCGGVEDPVLKEALNHLITANRSADHFEQLDAIHEVVGIPQKPVHSGSNAGPMSPIAITLSIIDMVWSYSFLHYFSVKKSREK